MLKYQEICNLSQKAQKKHGFIVELLFSFLLLANQVSAAIPTYAWERTNIGGGGAFSTVAAGPARNGGKPGIILVASDLSGAYRSLDAGQSWDVIGAYRGLTATHISAVGFHPNDARIQYLGTDAGIFRSANFGQTWSNVLASGYVTDIRLSAANPAMGYATVHSNFGTNDGVVYRTVNHGLSWQAVSGSQLNGHHILEIQIDPNNTEVIFALTGKGRAATACGPAAVFISRDNGVHWDKVTTDLPGRGQVMDMTMTPGNSDVIYVSTYGADVWEPGYEGCIHKDAKGGFLYQYTWLNNTWSRTTLTQRSGIIWADRDDANHIRLIDVNAQVPWNANNGTWESSDGGSSWTQVGQVSQWERGWAGDQAYSSSFNGDVKTLGEDLSNPDALLWINGQFVFRTDDDGVTFKQIYTREVSSGHWQSRGVDNVIMFDLAYSADSSTLYAALPDLGCLRSTDQGSSWQLCNDSDYTGSWQAYGGNAMTLASDPDHAAQVWITNANEINNKVHTLLSSSDFGSSWDAVKSWSAGKIPSGLAVDPGSPVSNRTLYITVDGDVWRGQSDGSNWKNIFSKCNGCRYTAVKRYGNDLYVYAGGEAGLWRSINGGKWVDVGGSGMYGNLSKVFYDNYWKGVAAIEPDPINSDWIYATVFGSNGGLYRSKARGDSGSWQKLKSDDFMRDVAVSPNNPNIIFATSSKNLYHGEYDINSGGVWYTDNGGNLETDWVQVNQGLDWPFANPIEIDPNDSSRLIMGSPGAGFYKGQFRSSYGTGDITLNAAQWYQVSLPAKPPQSANTVAKIFADDISGRYGSDWAVLDFNPDTNNYTKLGLNSKLSQGNAYWITHMGTATPALVDLPSGSSQTLVTQSASCLNVSGCYEIPLSTKLGEVQWNMIGNPFSQGVALNRVTVVTGAGTDCADGCSLQAAAALNIIHSQLWRYNDAVYEAITGGLSLNPWGGFWIATLEQAHGLNPKLLLPE